MSDRETENTEIDDLPMDAFVSDWQMEAIRNSSTDALIHLTDWYERKKGESIPFIPAAVTWEVANMVDVDNLVNNNGDDSMLPGIILTNAHGMRMGCTFNAKSTMSIARYLVENAAALMPKVDEKELRLMDDGLTEAFYGGAYKQMKALVEKDSKIKLNLMHEGAVALGYADGLKKVKPVIQKLVDLLDMPAGPERDELATAARIAIEDGLDS